MFFSLFQQRLIVVQHVRLHLGFRFLCEYKRLILGKLKYKNSYFQVITWR